MASEPFWFLKLFYLIFSGNSHTITMVIIMILNMRVNY